MKTFQALRPMRPLKFFNHKLFKHFSSNEMTVN